MFTNLFPKRLVQVRVFLIYVNIIENQRSYVCVSENEYINIINKTFTMIWIS